MATLRFSRADCDLFVLVLGGLLQRLDDHPEWCAVHASCACLQCVQTNLLGSVAFRLQTTLAE